MSLVWFYVLWVNGKTTEHTEIINADVLWLDKRLHEWFMICSTLPENKQIYSLLCKSSNNASFIIKIMNLVSQEETKTSFFPL